MMKYPVVSSTNDSSNIDNDIIEKIENVMEHEGKQSGFFLSMEVLC